jgi:proline iminopeptidase
VSPNIPARSLAAALLLCAACSASRPGPGAVHDGEPPRAAAGYVPGVGGVRLFYRVEGRGADTVVVLHGGPGLNLEGLRPDLRPLARRHALLYFDQRGGGRSERPDTLRLTGALMVEDLEALRRAFRLDRLTLLGHSWGGGLAVLYAARHPDRVGRLVLVGPVPPRQRYFPQYDANQAARRDSAANVRLQHLGRAQAVARDPYPVCREWFRLFTRALTAAPGLARRVQGDNCSGTPENVRGMDIVLRRVWASLTADGDPDGPYDWRPLARRVGAPALVVHGGADPIPLAGSAEWARALPRGRLEVIPGAGHFPHAERPERFFPAVEAFLAGRRPE